MGGITRGVSDAEPSFDTLAVAGNMGFYGKTPIAQRAAATQAASVVSATSYISVTSNLAAFCAEVAATLTALGIWKGTA